jgi:hypothetical protein
VAKKMHKKVATARTGVVTGFGDRNKKTAKKFPTEKKTKIRNFRRNKYCLFSSGGRGGV